MPPEEWHIPLTAPSPQSATPGADQSLWRPWLVFVAPFVVYMLLNTLEPARPAPPKPAAEGAAEKPVDSRRGWLDLGIPYRYYPLVYTLKIALTGALMLALIRDYVAISWRLSPLAIAVGVVGVCLWIGITELRLEPRLLEPIGLGGLIQTGTRSAYNPLIELRDWPLLAYGFLAVRFLGLVIVVPIIEEFFLRGFLMRYITDQKWWSVSLGAVSGTSIAVATAAAVAMHPAEMLAMLAWFLLVTWLMLRTQHLTDCVLAHATTNLLLGVYVLVSGDWTYL